MLRYVLARVRNQGYGLGNELIPWARAFLAAEVLQAKLLPPAFGLNRRGYWRDFRFAPDDWIYHRAVERLLPTVEFTEADYLAHGGDDVVSALRSFASSHHLQERTAYLLVTTGLWGGYYHIRAAREFIRATLYQSRYAAGNLLKLRERIDPDKPLIGMHVRLGDFKPGSQRSDYYLAPNRSLPLEWFISVGISLQRLLGGGLQFLLVTDGTEQQLAPLRSCLPCITTADLPNSDCSDALALADADLLVCSASTYSHLAAFLSESPYIWFAANLYQHPEGCYSAGDPAADLTRADSPRLRALRQFVAAPQGWVSRGVGVDLDGQVPAAMIQLLQQRRAYRRWQSDLMRGGVAPVTGTTATCVVGASGAAQNE